MRVLHDGSVSIIHHPHDDDDDDHDGDQDGDLPGDVDTEVPYHDMPALGQNRHFGFRLPVVL